MSNLTKILLFLIFLSLIVIGIFIYSAQRQNPPNALYKGEESAQVQNSATTSSDFLHDKNIYLIGTYFVNYDVDGDTIHAIDSTGKEDKIRFLVINTPEIHKDVNGKIISDRDICLGNISKKFTTENLLNHKVELWGDKTQPKRDKYNRLLAYIRIIDNGASSSVFFNDILMQKGYAKVYKASPPATYYEKYSQYQDQAKQQNLVMWNTALCN